MKDSKGNEYVYPKAYRDKDGNVYDVLKTEDYELWFKNDFLHRDNDLPAEKWKGEEPSWYQEGKLHRELGPAHKGKYYLHHVRYSRDVWLRKVTESQRVLLAEWWEERRRMRKRESKRAGSEALEVLKGLPRSCLAEVLMQISPKRL